MPKIRFGWEYLYVPDKEPNSALTCDVELDSRPGSVSSVLLSATFVHILFEGLNSLVVPDLGVSRGTSSIWVGGFPPLSTPGYLSDLLKESLPGPYHKPDLSKYSSLRDVFFCRPWKSSSIVWIQSRLPRRRAVVRMRCGAESSVSRVQELSP